MLDSKAFSLNINDAIALAKGALLVGAAAVLTFVAENIAKIDLGPNGVLIVPVISVVLDAAIKWLRNNKTDVK